jgi:hypothetical protein
VWVASNHVVEETIVCVEKVALLRLRAELEPLPESDAVSARDVIDVLLDQGPKIEQVRF